MSPHRCSYFKCNNPFYKSMFSFPWKDERRLNIWIQNCGNPAIANLTPKSLKYKYICIDHFDKKYLREGAQRRKRITRKAVPNPSFGSLEYSLTTSTGHKLSVSAVTVTSIDPVETVTEHDKGNSIIDAAPIQGDVDADGKPSDSNKGSAALEEQLKRILQFKISPTKITSIRAYGAAKGYEGHPNIDADSADDAHGEFSDVNKGSEVLDKHVKRLSQLLISPIVFTSTSEADAANDYDEGDSDMDDPIQDDDDDDDDVIIQDEVDTNEEPEQHKLTNEPSDFNQGPLCIPAFQNNTGPRTYPSRAIKSTTASPSACVTKMPPSLGSDKRSLVNLSYEKRIKVFCSKCKAELEPADKLENLQMLEGLENLIICKVYHYLKQEYEDLKRFYIVKKVAPLSSVRQRTAEATGVNETTVRKLLMAEKRKVQELSQPRKKRRKKKQERVKEMECTYTKEDLHLYAEELRIIKREVIDDEFGESNTQDEVSAEEIRMKSETDEDEIRKTITEDEAPAPAEEIGMKSETVGDEIIQTNAPGDASGEEIRIKQESIEDEVREESIKKIVSNIKVEKEEFIEEEFS